MKISSFKLELVKTAEIVLEEHFAKSNTSNQQVCVSRQPLSPEANPSLFFLAEYEDERSKMLSDAVRTIIAIIHSAGLCTQ